MTEKTMADLRREVATRLKQTLHGREIDGDSLGDMPATPEMLGVVPLGAMGTASAEEGTLLDPNHEFYDDYYREVRTKRAAENEIRTAIQSLKEDDILNITEPYGEDANILYVEVVGFDETTGLDTTCVECGVLVTAEPYIERKGDRYALRYRVDCPSCEFSRLLETSLIRT